MPKCMHEVLGSPIISLIIDAAQKAESSEIICVVGYRSDLVREKIGDAVTYAEQKEQLGTGHAVMSATEFIDPGESALVLLGDAPLIRAESIKRLREAHETLNNAVTVISTVVDNPFGYGRIIRDGGAVVRIAEQKDLNSEQENICEINTGFMIFEGRALLDALPKLTNKNASGEYYLTDAVQIMREAGLRTGVIRLEDPDEFMGINTRVQLAQAAAVLKRRRNEEHMLAGVTMANPETVYIDMNVEIGEDTVIYPNVMIGGKTFIGSNCVIGPNVRLTDVLMADGVTITESVASRSTIGRGATVGPFAYLRPGASIGEDCKIGDFVEVKNASVGNRSKASHLAYIGDADIGEDVNFGCGSITANYDGKNKSRTVVRDGAFIGSNSNLIAPVTVNERAYVAAGSTITDDVPEGSLAIARQRQAVKKGWADRKN